MQFLSSKSLEMFLNVMEEHHTKSTASQEIPNQAKVWLSVSSALLWRAMDKNKLAVKFGTITGSVLSQCTRKHWELKENLLLSFLRLFPAVFF